MRARPLLACLLVSAALSCGVRPASLVTAPPDATATPTPFQPEGLGGTGSSLSGPTAPLYPTLQATPASTGVPSPAARISQPAGQVSILLLGADQRPGAASFRTDTIVLLTLRSNGSASLVSCPRDLYVYIPGFSMSRINSAYALGGFDLLSQTFEYNMGLRPQHFVLTNFNGFRSIVDSLGGVDVSVGQRLQDARSGYPKGFTVGPGQVHMDGETALWYIRARLTTSDLDRLRRSQEVLAAIGQKLLNLDVLDRVPEFYEAYRQAVVTDLSLEDLLQLVPLLQAIGSDRLERYVMTFDQVSPWVEPGSGAEYLLPLPEGVRKLFERAAGIR